MLNVTQLTQTLEIPQSTISQHLSRLKKNVLSVERRIGDVRSHSKSQN
ncbi:ArsR family transcriptional regulator [Bacillus albus]|nr:ArsR family transcriptional regulator [Bacillus albus]